MKLFVRSILVRAPEGDSFRDDPEADPPHRQPREAAESGAGKRPPVVAANALWQAVLGEGALEPPPRGRVGRTAQRVTAEHESAEPVTQRQRIAVHAIAGPKLPFEVRGPRLIDAGDGGDRRVATDVWTAWPLRHDQSLGFEMVADRRPTRPRRLAIPTRRDRQEFGRPPTGMPRTDRDQRVEQAGSVVCGL